MKYFLLLTCTTVTLPCGSLIISDSAWVTFWPPAISFDRSCVSVPSRAWLVMAVKRGYINKSYRDAARKGYKGVLTKLSVGPDGLTNLIDICEGTNVGDLAYYFARKRNVVVTAGHSYFAKAKR